MGRETVLTNALLVLPDGVRPGTLVLREGRIAAVETGRSGLAGALDLEGDHLLPGLVDLHTDNLERQVQPRPGARWPSRSAMLAHDAQTAAAGVTTVLDALCVGELEVSHGRGQTFLEGIGDLDLLGRAGALRCDHLLHLRCELPAPDMPRLLEPVAGHPLLRMVSLMDHCPGAGQFADMDRYRAMLRRDGLDTPAAEARIERLAALRERHAEPNRAILLERIGGRGVPLAAHDDWSEAAVARNAADGVTISEFPVNAPAARAARAHGQDIVVGAPNLVRGGSHSGNVSAMALLREGLVDAIASDYVPAAMLEAVWRLAAEGVLELAAAVRLVAENPARMAGLVDRGRLAPGLRADLLRVRTVLGLPVMRSVWLAGERIA
ncbi:alpha-D-ribose 1-methylphosphonate 5-triphosphate diphosphatase [Roseomonas sp. OT10]|uniref:alpha-D-ribose 1-methylphosphonate 5-triphosphate diphosphatase n=1 Tax=Roseomonas cutis TaxID=2897332 RepID=UPI001E64877A|nr:alpha-D-ribose 1-methylphosphonate 5-triphosphate diphosphatase [Roseomonas sp. OT10]UFN51006.1 alpha-D-ribose 1-methylphosphonate 5-triphosphate diphosphatase [Roseomonas sp. OT10]